MAHIPVLLQELIYYLSPKPGDIILDATINGGGHAKAILKAIGKNGLLIGIDRDAVILKETRNKIPDKNIILINGNFRDLDELLKKENIKKIDGAIFDLGMSSTQIEESGRGFSFQKDEPLLMTYKTEIGQSDLPAHAGLTAKEIVNKWSEEDIANVLYKYGGERYSRRIAKNIVARRKKKLIQTTFELVDIIREAVPRAYRNDRRLNCATRTFQALRIAVNDELAALEEGIDKAFGLLAQDGRIVVISFHSLEDKIVKNFFRQKAKKGGNILTKKPIKPSSEEIKINPRARSAKLRAIEKRN